MADGSVPFVSVIVPTFDRARPLQACLSSLARQTYPAGRWEAIVVDDGSSDETPGVLRRFESALSLQAVRHVERRGSGPARNTALARARGDLVVFLDSDTAAPPWFLAEHVRSHDGRRCFVDGPAIDVRAGCLSSFPFRAPHVRLLAALDLGGARFVTANVSCRREDILAAGGFDPAFGARYGWEDTELGIRLRALGVARVKNRRAYVLHTRVSGYDWRERGRKQEEAGLNAAYFLRKHSGSDVARLVRGRRRLAHVLTACGIDADRLAGACARHASRSPFSWALHQMYEIQQYERGLRLGSGPARLDARREPA